ncbi:MAG: DUF3999 domain-containing protein [Flexibacter sp. CG_4_10_14_3_um_filter_32_15]|nr:MAG: DUF3999 domain-containing protein [Flexibacter sp. CG_4_10_14_3_um_filter_32_15]
MKKIIFQFSFILALFLLSTTVFAQNFLYKREIKGIQNSKQTEWYKINIPIEVLEKTNTDFSDIRIFGVSDSDTLETPFLTRKVMQKSENEKVNFKIINSSKKDNSYFFTLEKENNTEESINLIKLDFQNTNFDWRIKLEGSQDQKEWFEVLNDYRIVSIQNEFTNYSFNKLIFPNSKYKYYRINISDKSENQSESSFKNNEPKLNFASVFLQKTTVGNFEDIKIISQNVEVNKEKKQTIIDIQLVHSVPVDFLSLYVKNDFDYYRTIQFKYLLDSTITEKGMIYNFVTLHTNTLSSLEKQNGISSFFINSSSNSNIKSKKYQIIIENQDNQPLDIGKLEMKGYVNQLFARVTPIDKNSTYFLMYGNERLQKPNYDIVRFENTIPTDLISLKLEAEQKTPQKEVEKVTPLFENSLWLWLLMGIIILVLTVFTFKMMKK